MAIIVWGSAAATRDETTEARPVPCATALCRGRAFLLEHAVVDRALPPPALPDFSQGGIVVYFHLYKTGGTSITELIVKTKEEHEDASQYLVIHNYNNGQDLDGGFDIQDSITLVQDHGKTIFYNFDSQSPSNCPTLVEAIPVLDGWRRAAKAAGVPFFVTTVVREPLAHAVSFFNFFHVFDYDDEDDWNPFTSDLAPTEDNFLKTYSPNRLCHWLYDDVHGILEAPEFALRAGLWDNRHHYRDAEEERTRRRHAPSPCDLEVVRKLLFGGTFDYVGVTERLSTQMLPMLTAMVFGDHTLAQEADQKLDITTVLTTDAKSPLTMDTLSDATRDMVLRESSQDTALYEEARDRFAHWPRYFQHAEDLGVHANKESCSADDSRRRL